MVYIPVKALNLAEYSVHMKRKCPVVFMISDNQMCISLKDDNWIKQVLFPSLALQLSGSLAQFFVLS